MNENRLEHNVSSIANNSNKNCHEFCIDSFLLIKIQFRTFSPAFSFQV